MVEETCPKEFDSPFEKVFVNTICPERNLKESALRWFIENLNNGPRREYFVAYDNVGWLHTMSWKVSPGYGCLPTDRGKNRTKRHLLVNENGVPLSLVVSGANCQDSVSLDSLLKNTVVKERKRILRKISVLMQYMWAKKAPLCSMDLSPTSSQEARRKK